MDPRKQAFLNRQKGPDDIRDGLIETAGLADDDTFMEPHEVDAVEHTIEAPQSPNTEEQPEQPVVSNDPSNPADGLEQADPDRVEAVKAELGADTNEELEEMTVPELKELADSRDIDYKSDVHKADLIELIQTS